MLDCLPSSLLPKQFLDVEEDVPSRVKICPPPGTHSQLALHPDWPLLRRDAHNVRRPHLRVLCPHDTAARDATAVLDCLPSSLLPKQFLDVEEDVPSHVKKCPQPGTHSQLALHPDWPPLRRDAHNDPRPHLRVLRPHDTAARDATAVLDCLPSSLLPKQFCVYVSEVVGVECKKRRQQTKHHLPSSTAVVRLVSCFSVNWSTVSYHFPPHLSSRELVRVRLQRS